MHQHASRDGTESRERPWSCGDLQVRVAREPVEVVIAMQEDVSGVAAPVVMSPVLSGGYGRINPCSGSETVWFPSPKP